VSDADLWIYMDGPEPADLRPVLAALRDVPPAPHEERERDVLSLMNRLDAMLGPPGDAKPLATRPPPTPAPGTLPVHPPGSTVRSPSLADAGPAPPSAEPTAVPTPRIPVVRSGFGDTAPSADESISKAVAAVASFPAMTLEAYASLRAELAVRPDAAEEILWRYQVPNRAAHKALDDHWKALFRERPDERARFEELVVPYIAHVASLPR
jgi:hypothetical protein